jgi:hypothetical protein
MNTPRLIGADDAVVALDYHSFYLFTSPDGWSHVLDALDSARDGIGIADGVVTIHSPHQNNFDMPLRTEVWSAEPPSDLDDWQEAFEVHVDVGDYGLVYDTPTLELYSTLPVPPGSYHLLITGRGFVAIGWPGSTSPGDSWRLRLWPSDGPVHPARLAVFADPRVEHPSPAAQHVEPSSPTIEHVEPTSATIRHVEQPRPTISDVTHPNFRFRPVGVPAVRRIHRAFDDATVFSGVRGTATAQRRMPGPRHLLFPYFHDPTGWLTQGGGRLSETSYALFGVDHDDEAFGDANRIVPRKGRIDCHILATVRPAHVLASWSWLQPPTESDPLGDPDLATVELVDPNPPMTLRFDLRTAPDRDGTPTTLMRVTHDQVPATLVEDLSAYWEWMLERADYEFDLSGARRDGYTG